MINALSPTWVVRALTALVIAISGVGLLASSPSAALSLWRVVGTVTEVVNLIVLALTFRPIFLLLYRATFASRWWFPLLEGEWVGELRSNWPRVEAMMLAAKGERPNFDALADELPSGGLITTLEATLSCSLFEISMEIRIPGTQRESRTIFVRPQRKPVPQIAYVYDQIDHGRVAVTDAARHRGAAVLEFDKRSGELRGEYWTNRQGTKGLNTAGSLILRRAGSVS